MVLDLSQWGFHGITQHTQNSVSILKLKCATVNKQSRRFQFLIAQLQMMPAAIPLWALILSDLASWTDSELLCIWMETTKEYPVATASDVGDLTNTPFPLNGNGTSAPT